MEVALTCIQILEFLHSVYAQMKSNSAEAKRLIDRVEVFKHPLDALILQGKTAGATNLVYKTKQRGLDNLLSLLSDIKVFIGKFSQPTYWRFAMKLAFRNANAAELAGFIDRISSCSGDLQFGLLVDNESLRREQDLADAKASFDMCVERSLSEAATRDMLDEIRDDVATYQASITEMLKVRGHGSLRAEEAAELRLEVVGMTERSNRRLDQIAASLGANIAIHFATLPSF